MMRPALSPAAAGMLRGLLARVGEDRHRIILIDFRSTDWQSLTFIGERHELTLRILPPQAATLVDRLLGRIDEAEWQIPRQIVADVRAADTPKVLDDGSVEVRIEALTIEE